LTVWAIAMIDESKILTGSVLFVMSICFKQMSLYFAPAFFFYLLRYAFHQKNAKSSLKVIFSLGTTVIITFVFCFVPFLQSKELFFQVIHRIFPLARGLFEDKVSNFWCVTNLVIKWQRSFSNASLAKLR
jgi:alpha-1,3-glucosyltransferase